MIQLYFLSVLFNGLSGYLFIWGDGGEKETIESSFRFSLHNETFHLVLGILSAVTGLLKLLSPSIDNIPILGDLVPALMGLLAGFILVFGYYREHKSVTNQEEDGKLDKLGEALLKYKKGFGLILLVTALAHFIFPQALFL
ncbi:MAG: hypothetical protein LBJ90_05100 [Treponema sp.]|jgi:hypothetical protein|nr:hypothetical protein [Treponema sp.]